MERILTLLIASLTLAPLYYFATSGLIIVLNQSASGPDDRLGVAYLSTFAGFAAAFVGLFITWFLASRFLLPHHLRLLQLIDAIALVGWFVVYLLYSNTQPQRLDYAEHTPVLDIEVRATRAILNGQPITSMIDMRFYDGTSFDTSHPELIRQEADAVVLPWETVPFEVDQWGVVVFLKNNPVLFPIDLPRRPTQSTEWSEWVRPIAYQNDPVPPEAQQGLTLRYRFRLVPHGQQR